MNTLANFAFLVRYGVVGVAGGLLQTLTLYLWVGVLGLQNHYLVGAVVGFCIALAVTFVLQKYWTFGHREHTRVHTEFITYTSIALASLGLNVVFQHLAKTLLEQRGFDFFNVWYLVAQVVSIGILAGLSFMANYFFTFRTRV